MPCAFLHWAGHLAKKKTPAARASSTLSQSALLFSLVETKYPSLNLAFLFTQAVSGDFSFLSQLSKGLSLGKSRGVWPLTGALDQGSSVCCPGRYQFIGWV